MTGQLQTPSLLLVVSALFLFSNPVQAEGPPSKISQEALDRVSFGLDAHVEPQLRLVAPNQRGVQGVTASVHFGASARLGKWSLGLDHGVGYAGLNRFEGSLSLTRLILRSGSPSGDWWELGLGMAGVDENTENFYVFSSRAGYQFTPFKELPNLTIGPTVGIELWAMTGAVDAPNFVVQAGGAARFILPLTYKAPPPVQVYLLASADTAAVTDNAQDAEVTATPTYEQVLPKLRRVALSAPDYCASRTAADATGQGTQTGRLMQTNCGVEMGEVERALTRAGYIVSSWTTLASMVQDQRMTPRDAAAKLGAEVLFQVNSLEHVQAVPQLEVNWKRRYFASNAYGDKLEEVFPTPQELPSLQRLVGAAGASQNAVPGAMLDVNAILVETGQTIWFYRWQHLDTSETQVSNGVLATKLENEAHWKETYPLPRGTGPGQPVGLAADSGSYQAAGGPANAGEARSFRLMREVVADFVDRFTQKQPVR